MLREVILPSLARYRMVDEIIISHGRADTAFDFFIPSARVVIRDDSEVNSRLGIARRWLCWEAARNDTVLSLDDDILLPESSLNALHKAFVKNPRALHGLTVDMPLGFDSFMPQNSGNVNLVSGAYLLPQSMGRLCLERMDQAEDYVRDPFNSCPLWDGDDIFASLVACQVHASVNRAHRLPYRDLGVMCPDNNICHDSLRLARRNEMAKVMSGRLGVRMLPQPKSIVPVLRKIKRKVRNRKKQVLMSMRETPSLFILGASRSGTTALFKYLQHHEQFMSPQKENATHAEGAEPELLSLLRKKEIGRLAQRMNNLPSEKYRYHRLYPWKLPWRRRFTIDGTPHLLSSFSAPYSIKADFPTARMLVLLRNPVDRVLSLYRMRKKLIAMIRPSLTYPTLEEWLDMEKHLVCAGLPVLFYGQWHYLIQSYFPDYAEQMPPAAKLATVGYVSTGLYARWLERYFRLFPREQIMVIQSERFFAEPHDVLKKVHAFLGLDITEQCHPELFQRMHASEGDDVLNPELRARLAALFKEPNKRLFKLLGETYDWD